MSIGIATITIPGAETRLRYASSPFRTGNCRFFANIRDCRVGSKNV